MLRGARAARRLVRAAGTGPRQTMGAFRASSNVKTTVEEAEPAELAPAAAAPAATAPLRRAAPAFVEEVREFPGGARLPISTRLVLADPQAAPRWPVYRVLDREGRLLPNAEAPELDEATAVRMYRVMLRLQTMDNIFYNAQRQGRISFYLTSTGEEATHVGSAAALDDRDVVFAQYREAGVLMWRGFSLEDFADQCYGNASDLGKGRQMPVHYGSRDLHFHTISSPLATQIPQAVGAGFALKQESEGRIAVVYFGEGAASEGDFHAALNFSATLEVPMVFFCRNNGYAISTPVKDQYRGDGIVARAPGYGVTAIRVDGNDVLAVYHAVAEARAYALAQNRPVLVEAMTYRIGHHSTSDDSTRYRGVNEIRDWADHDDPGARFRAWIEGNGWWSETLEDEVRRDERMAVLRAIESAEKKGPPPLESLFDDVYSEMPPNLQRQKKELLEHVKRHPEFYGEKHQ